MQKMKNTQNTCAARSRLFTYSKTLILGCLCALLFLLMLLAPAQGIAGARAGLLLCGDVIVPSLFPLLVLSVFVINTGLAQRFGRLFEKPVRAVFKLPGSAAAALGLGLIGGYPVGARACADLYRTGALEKRDAERLLVFSINSSPAFIIGAVGSGLLGSTQAGVLLYCAHIAASLIIGVLSCAFRKPERRVTQRAVIKSQPVPTAFVSAVTSSATSILNICAFVVLFSSLVSLLIDTGICGGAALAINHMLHTSLIDPDFFGRLIRGFLEVSTGCACAASQGSMAGILLITAFLSWSGLSVVFQVIYAVKDVGLSAKYYVLSRIPHMTLSTLLTVALFRLFPVAVPTFASSSLKLAASVHTAPASAALLIVCSLLLLSMVKV
jgi:sporulation integral membrane protein YlbJ